MDDIDPIYYKNVPRQNMASSVLFMDIHKKILLVQTWDHHGWNLPGARLEKGESPKAACERATQEILKFNFKPDRLLAMDFVKQGSEETLHLVFLGGLLSDKIIKKLEPNQKLSQVMLAKLDQLNVISDAKLASRIRKSVDALEHERTLVLENGEYT